MTRMMWGIPRFAAPALIVVAILALSTPAQADVYVSGECCGAAHFDNAGNSLPDLSLPYSGVGPFPGSLGLTVGPDGDIYTAADQSGVGYIAKFDPNSGAFLGYFVTPGGGGLSGPRPLDFGPDGNLYVGDGNQILKFNGQTGAFMGVFATITGSATGLTFGPDGNLYVAEALPALAGDVLKFNGSTGAPMGVFATGLLSQLFSTFDLTFGKDGNLYVSAPGVGVMKFNGSTGAPLGTFVANGSGGLAFPWGIVFSPDGSILYVVDWFGQDVLTYNASTGAFLSVFGGVGSPTYIAVTPNATGYVRYAANLNIGDSAIHLTNDGASGGDICANVYTFSPDQQVVACCACLITPNGLATLSAQHDLIANPLTPSVPNAIVIKLIATAPAGGVCNPAVSSSIVSGLDAWGTTLHAAPSPPTYRVTEGPFSAVTLSGSEISKDVSYCAYIQDLRGTPRICTSCLTPP